jgi:predicted AlkP superfamily phosphohydrolase/phosphomutase
MIDAGELPALRRLLGEGAWSRVASPAHIGSGAVWPTFITGTGPLAHGVYGEWIWQPATMSVTRFDGRQLRPFWTPLAREGRTVGLLDVPFAPFVGASTGFEVSEWGPHDVVTGRTEFAPKERLERTLREAGPHPFALEHLDATGPDDHAGLATMSAAALAGARSRGALAHRLIEETHPDLALVVFTEIHHLAHYLWHTVEPENPLFATDACRRARAVDPSLRDLYREVDAQIGTLVAAAPDAAVFVFSHHGMRATHGVPALLGPCLIEAGWARLADLGTQTWSTRARSLLAAAKRHAPPALKHLYYRTMPRAVVSRVAQPTMLPPYDWAHTRAFALPTDQHGWVRVNLAGREAHGIVPMREYDETCRRLMHMLGDLATRDGRPLVRDVIRPAPGPEDALALGLPDLVVHWHDAALDAPVAVRGMTLESFPVGLKFTGQHALDGFLIARDRRASVETVSGQDLHRLFVEALGARGDPRHAPP